MNMEIFALQAIAKMLLFKKCLQTKIHPHCDRQSAKCTHTYEKKSTPSNAHLLMCIILQEPELRITAQIQLM